MADAKISALPLGTPTGSDVIPYVDGASGITRKAFKSSLIGPQGTQGSVGPQGSQGSVGPQGTQGSVGPQGSQGSQGTQSTAPGAQGPTGPQGTQGSQGSQGDPGSQGVAGPQGSQGSIGLQGTQGSQGSASTAPGPQGTQGSIGVQGTQGSQGSAGPQGTQGTGNTVRVSQQATAGSAAPNADTTDTFRLTAQTLTADFVNPSGTPTNGQKLFITILPSNGNRNLTWGSAYTAGGVALPTSVTQAKRTTIGFEYDTSNSLNAWMCLGSATQT